MARTRDSKVLSRRRSLYDTGGVYNEQWSDMFIETNWIRKGHGPAGITGNTESPQTMATWVFSMNAMMTLAGDLKKMLMKLLNLCIKKNPQVVFNVMCVIVYYSRHFTIMHWPP